ncbi:MAG: hypothetical protein U5L95_03515 [Candidatus Saccharibacteria bacterium]|nr:hypothetical protein [Candidatus Saccharibacteria bacterium]
MSIRITGKCHECGEVTFSPDDVRAYRHEEQDDGWYEFRCSASVHSASEDSSQFVQRPATGKVLDLLVGCGVDLVVITPVYESRPSDSTPYENADDALIDLYTLDEGALWQKIEKANIK